MSEQLELQIFKKGPKKIDSGALVEFLLHRPGWITAKEMKRIKGWPDRTVRRMAEHTIEVITGQYGYQHIDHATAEEIRHFINWMESQSRKMTQRAEAVRRRAHKKIG